MAKRWYIVHAYTNFERKVADAIRERAKQAGLEHLFEEIVVPTEEVIEIRRGRKVPTERKFLPGYVLVRMEMTDAAFLLIKNTPKVTGFLGAEGGKKPLPVRQREVDRILGKSTDETADRPRPRISFEIGEQVQVNDGPFQGFEGAVEEIDEANGRLKVTVSIFRRGTPVDLEFDQVVNMHTILFFCSRLHTRTTIQGHRTHPGLHTTSTTIEIKRTIIKCLCSDRRRGPRGEHRARALRGAGCWTRWR